MFSYIGYIPEKDLANIYNLARFFIYPSFYEGFGLPPSEAMACGCPVIVSLRPVYPKSAERQHTILILMRWKALPRGWNG